MEDLAIKERKNNPIHRANTEVLDFAFRTMLDAFKELNSQGKISGSELIELTETLNVIYQERKAEIYTASLLLDMQDYLNKAFKFALSPEEKGSVRDNYTRLFYMNRKKNRFVNA